MAAVQFYIPYDIMVKPGNLGTPNGTVGFYAPGTLTKRAVYATSALTTQLSNPVVADGAGRLPAIYLDNSISYRVRAFDKAGALLIDRDPYIPGQAPDSSALAPYQAAAAASAASAGASSASALAAVASIAASSAAATSAAASATTSAATAAAAASTAVSAATGLSPSNFFLVTPEMYGAVGNGTTNDTAAFQALGTAITGMGGGTISLRPGATYLVGLQTLVNDGQWMFKGQNVLYITGCTRGLKIIGAGAKFKFANGLKFGTFTSGGVSDGAVAPNMATTNRSAPTADNGGIITITNCTGPVWIENIEFDGNVSNMVIGGEWSTTGRQLPGDALNLFSNTGGVVCVGVKGYAFPRDGGMSYAGGVAGDAPPLEPHVFINCSFTGNCRNNFSHIGGRGYYFQSCKFLNAGVSTPFWSAPGANFDVEAEVGSIRDLAFDSCIFGEAVGVGLVAASGDIARVTADKCVFSNTMNFSLWPAAPYMTFNHCTIGGAINLPFDSTWDEWRAPLFYRCLITDNDTFSVSGAAFGGAITTLVNGAGGSAGYGVKFRECKFDAGHHGTFAGLGGSIFQDCTISVAAPNIYGLYSCQFRGYNVVTSPSAGLGSYVTCTFGGRFVLNGVEQFRASATYNPPSIANGATSTTTLTVPGCDQIGAPSVLPSFSLPLQGVRLFGWVSAANTVSVSFRNDTGGAIDLASGTLAAKVMDLAA